MYLDIQGYYFIEEKGKNKYGVYFQTTDGNIFLIKEYKSYHYAWKYADKLNKSKNGIIY